MGAFRGDDSGSALSGLEQTAGVGYVQFDAFDVCVVGAGFFGATIAERVANDLGKRVLLLDRRGHIGGNSYSEPHSETGIEVHKYGAHIFHTSNESVWNYVRQFSEFNSYIHRVYSSYNGELYSMPINLATISQFFRRHMSPTEARCLIASQAGEAASQSPRNLEEKAISLIGLPLYEAFIRGYTWKQWEVDPKELPANIITRLPVRYSLDNRYFNDPYQGIPSAGYGALFERMLNNSSISTCLNTDFFDIRNELPSRMPIVYTGPVDRYFNYSAGVLDWRSLRFEEEVVPLGDFQGTSVINYSNFEVPFTRIIEFRHFDPSKAVSKEKTVIWREFSKSCGANDEPFYPVNSSWNERIYAEYKQLAARAENVLFGGRLGTYRYLDMHQAIGAALSAYERVVRPALIEGAPLNRMYT